MRSFGLPMITAAKHYDADLHNSKSTLGKEFVYRLGHVSNSREGLSIFVFG